MFPGGTRADPARISQSRWNYACTHGELGVSPKIVGGLGRHVEGLSEALVRAGHEVTVVTGDSPKLPEKQVVQGVEVLRALPINLQVAILWKRSCC